MLKLSKRATNTYNLYDIAIIGFIVFSLALYDLDYLYLGIQFAVIGISFLNLLYHQGKMLRKVGVFAVWIIAFGLLCFTSWCWADARNTTVISCTIAVIQAGLMTYCILQHGKNAEKVAISQKAFILACVILVVRFLLTVPVSSWGQQTRFAKDTFFGTNMIAMTLAYGAYFVLNDETVPGKLKFNIPRIIAAAAFMFVSVLLGTKKGILLFGITMAITIIGQTSNPIKKIRNILFVGALAGIAFFMVMNIPILYDAIGYRIESMLSGFLGNETDGSTRMRTLFAQNALDVFKAHPLLGVGLDGFRYLNQYEFTYSHNNYTEILACLGLLGFVIFYFYYAYLAVKALKQGKKGLVALALITAILVCDFAMVSYSDELNFIVLALTVNYLFLPSDTKEIQLNE